MFKDVKVYTSEYQNGFSLASMGAVVTRESSIDMIPNRTVNTASVFGRPGSLKSKAVLGTRAIRLVIHFTTEDLPIGNPFQLFTLDELDDFLTRLFINNHQPFELELIELPGRFYKAHYDSSVAPRLYLKDGRVSYTLTCYDPYIYGDNMNLILLQDPYSIDIDARLSILNVYPQFVFPLDHLGEIIYKDSSGAETLFTFNPKPPATPTSGDVTVDTYNRTIIGPNGENLVPSYKDGWPFVPAGDIGYFKAVNPGVEIKYRVRYLY